MNSCYIKEDIVNVYNDLKLVKIPLRELLNQNILDIDNNLLNEEINKLKEAKIKIGWLDLAFSYSIKEEFDFDNLINLSKITSSNHLVLNLPELKEFETEKEESYQFLNNLIKTFKQAKIKVSFHIDYEINSAKLAHLITKVKGIDFVFNPSLCLINNKSISAYYRLIKNNISLVIINDINEKKEPTLLLYGISQIKEMKERFKLDNYKGDILYDFNLFEYLENREKLYKKRLPFTKGKSFKAHLFIEEKLELNKQSKLTYRDLLINQFNIVNHIFK